MAIKTLLLPGLTILSRLRVGYSITKSRSLVRGRKGVSPSFILACLVCDKSTTNMHSQAHINRLRSRRREALSLAWMGEEFVGVSWRRWVVVRGGEEWDAIRAQIREYVSILLDVDLF
jgi:hypothetical protein